MTLSDKELELLIVNDGIKELDTQLDRLKRWVEEKRWSEVYVHLSKLIRVLQGMRKTVKRLET